MKILLANLKPSTAYYFKLKGKNGKIESEWSKRFTLTTINYTTNPNAPNAPTWVAIGNSFHGTWSSVNTNSSGAVVPIVRYDVELTGGQITYLTSVLQNTGALVTYDLPFENNRIFFGSPQSTVSIRIRSVDNLDRKSAWSPSATATNGPPGPPTNPGVVEGTDSIDIFWTAPSDSDLLHYNVYVGATEDFTPALLNRVFQGSDTRFTYTSTTYILQYFKIRAVDTFFLESVDAVTSGTPVSPFVVDVVPPGTPEWTGGSIVNNANGIGAVLNTSWSQTLPSPNDLTGFEMRYRKVGDTNWNSAGSFPADARAATIALPIAYVNYEFNIRSFDKSGNNSAWVSNTFTSPANTPPGNVTGLVSVSNRESIRYNWSTVTDEDLRNYEVTFSTSSTFASGNITFLTGSANYLDVGGLTPGTTYYARVRAVDVAGLSSTAWSGTDTKATLSYSTYTSDGVAPTSSPTPTIASGIGYLHAQWTAVTNNDPVTYEVHLSTTTNFTPSGSTKVAETPSTTVILEKDGAGVSLAYDIIYFVKIIAKDRDGSAAASAQGSATLFKAVSNDLNIGVGGGNIATNSGFEDSPLSGLYVQSYSGGSASRETVATNVFNGQASLKVTPGGISKGVILWPTVMSVATEYPSGSVFVASARVKGTAGQVWSFASRISNSTSTYLTESAGGINFTTDGTWQWVKTTPFTYSSGNFIPGVQFVLQSLVGGELLYIDNYQIELGDIATSWGPRVQDAIEFAGTAQSTAELKNTTFVTGSTPSALKINDIWVDTANGNIIKVATATGTGGWVTRQDGAIFTAQTAANTAQTTASGKNSVFVQSTAPTAIKVNDIWIDTGNGNVVKTWNGTTWNVTQDGAIAIAQASANGKNNIYYSTAVAPAGTGGGYVSGDTWFRKDGAGTILGQWEWIAGTGFVSKTLNSAIIASLDVGKLTSGSISTADIALTSSGYIRSTDYVASTTGWRLGNGSLEINNGTIRASALSIFVGGGNLLRNSGAEDGMSSWSASNAISCISSAESVRIGSASFKVTATSAETYSPSQILSPRPALGTKVTVSSYMRATVAGRFGRVYLNQFNGATLMSSEPGPSIPLIVGSWVRVYGTFTIRNDIDSADAYPSCYFNAAAANEVYYVDSCQVEEGDVLTAFAPKVDEILPGTISAPMMQANSITVGNAAIADAAIGSAKIINLTADKLNTGTMAASIITLGAGGIIKTNNSNVSITDQGIFVTGGSQITASALTTGTFGAGNALTVNGNIALNGNMLVQTGGYIKSTEYTGTTFATNPSALGWYLGRDGLKISSGAVSASTLTAGTLGSSTGFIQIGAGAALVLNGGYIKSNAYTGTAYSATATAGFYLGDDGLRIANGSVSAATLTTGDITSASIVVATGSEIKTAGYNGTAGFRLSTSGLEIPNGAINISKILITNDSINGTALTSISGNKITTGTIQSNNFGTSGQPYWSIALTGAATFAALSVLGNTVLGTGTADTTSLIGTSGYVTGAAVGWQIKANGDAIFSNAFFNGTGNSITLNAGTMSVSGGNIKITSGFLSGAGNTGTSISTAINSNTGYYLGSDGFYLGSGTITGGIIQTASSGNRVEMSYSSDSTYGGGIKFYYNDGTARTGSIGWGTGPNGTAFIVSGGVGVTKISGASIEYGSSGVMHTFTGEISLRRNSSAGGIMTAGIIRGLNASDASNGNILIDANFYGSGSVELKGSAGVFITGTLNADTIQSSSRLTIGNASTGVNATGYIKTGGGTLNMAVANTAYNTGNIAFGTAFPTSGPVPTISVQTLNVVGANNVSWSVSSISRSGFTIYGLRSAGSAGTDFSWIAIAQ